MVTIVTHVTLTQGAGPEWDAGMRERMQAVQHQPGWVGGQLLMPLDDLNRRVIVGTWHTRADWEAWHNDAAFTETRRRLGELEARPHDETWHEVIEIGEGRGAIAA